MALHVSIGQLEKQMGGRAHYLELEEAARVRDEITKLGDKKLGMATMRPSPPLRASAPACEPSSRSRDDEYRTAQTKAKPRRRTEP